MSVRVEKAALPLRDVTAIVLAGGRASRFGSDKLAADVDGSTVLEHAIAAVAAIAEDVIVAGPDRLAPPEPGSPSVRLLADPEPFGGPLQALAGALDTTTSELVIVVAGDMPSLVPDVLALLVDALAGAPDVDALVLGDPRDPTRRQPLPSALRVLPARRAAAATLDDGDRSLVRMLDRLALAEVPVDRWRTLDPEAWSLLDVDTTGDLDQARRGAREHRMR